MKTFNWRHTSWTDKKFIFSEGEQELGQLSFHKVWNFDAIYSDSDSTLEFVQKGTWGRHVQILKDGEPIGQVKFSVWGNQALQFASGEQYTLYTNAWGGNVHWKTEGGEVPVRYHTAPLSSMGKGEVNVDESLPEDAAKVLMVSGLFVRQLIQKRVAVLVAIFIPIIAASN